MNGGIFETAPFRAPSAQSAYKQPPRPNVKLIRFYTPRIGFELENEPTGRVRFYESGDQDRQLGIVLSFRNESLPTGVCEARYVHTQIIYRDKDGKEVGHGILAASWMDHSYDIIDIPVGRTRCALVGLIDKGGDAYTTWVDRRDSVIYTEYYPWPANTAMLEVRLLDENSEWLVEPVVLEVTTSADQPPIVIRKK